MPFIQRTNVIPFWYDLRVVVLLEKGSAECFLGRKRQLEAQVRNGRSEELAGATEGGGAVDARDAASRAEPLLFHKAGSHWRLLKADIDRWLE